MTDTPQAKPMLVGYSLSFCIKDVIQDGIDPDQIDHIVTATAIKTAGDMAAVLEHYADVYWTEDPERAVMLAIRLFNAGKIIQPRLTNPDYSHSIAAGWWENA